MKRHEGAASIEGVAPFQVARGATATHVAKSVIRQMLATQLRQLLLNPVLMRQLLRENALTGIDCELVTQLTG